MREKDLSGRLSSQFQGFHSPQLANTFTVKGEGTFTSPWVINKNSCWSQWVYPNFLKFGDESVLGFQGNDTEGYIAVLEDNRRPYLLRVWDQGNVDDHNALSFLPIVRVGTDDFYIFGTAHQTDSIMRIGQGTELNDLTLDGSAFTTTDDITYTQPVRYNDRIMCLTRLKWASVATDPRNWIAVESTDNGSSWAQRTVFEVNTADTSAADQIYMLWKQTSGNQVNIAMYENAANGSTNSVFMGYADLTDGTLYDMSDTDNGDIYSTTTPIRVHQDLSTIYTPASGTTKLRLWDMHYDEFDFITAEGASENACTYRYHWVTGTSVTSEDLVAAGDVITEDGVVRYYHCGAAIIDRGRVVVARENNGTYYLDLMTSASAGSGWTTTNLRTSGNKIFRPVVEKGGSATTPLVAWLEGDYYAYFNQSTILGRAWTCFPHIARIPS